MSISIGGLDYGLPQCKECGIYSLSVRMGRCDVSGVIMGLIIAGLASHIPAGF